jgi:hypothetical protein
MESMDTGYILEMRNVAKTFPCLPYFFHRYRLLSACANGTNIMEKAENIFLGQGLLNWVGLLKLKERGIGISISIYCQGVS